MLGCLHISIFLSSYVIGSYMIVWLRFVIFTTVAGITCNPGERSELALLTQLGSFGKQVYQPGKLFVSFIPHICLSLSFSRV